jgi:hypothetical protein
MCLTHAVERRQADVWGGNPGSTPRHAGNYPDCH